MKITADQLRQAQAIYKAEQFNELDKLKQLDIQVEKELVKIEGQLIRSITSCNSHGLLHNMDCDVYNHFVKTKCEILIKNGFNVDEKGKGWLLITW